ncbi:hypothetical protein [Luteolibacter sp. Populi]|uniref:hypothetical protein n=1 Tax=Luteolibacter sp. Populi TaxID=3230487 RepID=UPI003466821E
MKRPCPDSKASLAGQSSFAATVLALSLAFSPGALALVDSDGDGMSDMWESLYGFTVGGGAPTGEDPTADPDGDGWSNFEEATAGTDPGSGNPPAGIVRTAIETDPMLPDTVYISWQSDTTKAYQLKGSLDLGTWFDVGRLIAGDGEEIRMGASATMAPPDPEDPFPVVELRLFWRVAIEDMDSDGDGLVDFEEDVLGLDSMLLDEDGDGIPSYIEVLNGWNPLVPNSATDLGTYLISDEGDTFQVFTPLHQSTL